MLVDGLFRSMMRSPLLGLRWDFIVSGSYAAGHDTGIYGPDGNLIDNFSSWSQGSPTYSGTRGGYTIGASSEYDNGVDLDYAAGWMRAAAGGEGGWWSLNYNVGSSWIRLSFPVPIVVAKIVHGLFLPVSSGSTLTVTGYLGASFTQPKVLGVLTNTPDASPVLTINSV